MAGGRKRVDPGNEVAESSGAIGGGSSGCPVLISSVFGENVPSNWNTRLVCYASVSLAISG